MYFMAVTYIFSNYYNFLDIFSLLVGIHICFYIVFAYMPKLFVPNLQISEETWRSLT